MSKSKEVAEAFTHEIFYQEGNTLTQVRCTTNEAKAALEAWKIWRPVPVPNKKDPKRSCRMINPQKVDTIKRFRYLTP